MKLIIALLLLTISTLSLAKNPISCFGHIRFIHGEAFRDEAITVKVNGVTVEENLPFRGVTNYIEFSPGKKNIEFFNASTGVLIESTSFSMGPNMGHTIVFAGPALGPEGMRHGNKSPFIFIDDITPVTNNQRWKGTWYRMSETNVVIDFRISNGKNPEQEIGRLVKKQNRSSYQLGDFPAGNYQFNPVMVGSSEPLFNVALVPAKNVEIKDLEIKGGETVDIIALGNFLGKTPNSLDLTYKKYVSTVNKNGCFEIKQ